MKRINKKIAYVCTISVLISSLLTACGEPKQLRQYDKSNPAYVDGKLDPNLEKAEPEREITWTDDNTMVFAVKDLELKSGTKDTYETLATISKGTEIQRIGLGDNGWAKVVYEDKVMYVFNGSLTERSLDLPFDGSIPSEDIKKQTETDLDLVGVLFIPDINLKPTKIYRISEYDQVQPLADAVDMGYALGINSYYDEKTHRVEIGDHSHQNFCNNTKITEGMMGYLNMGDKVLRMKCISNNLEENIADYNLSIKNERDYICTLTCAPNGTRTVTRWSVCIDSDITFDDYYKMVTKYTDAQKDQPWYPNDEYKNPGGTSQETNQ